MDVSKEKRLRFLSAKQQRWQVKRWVSKGKTGIWKSESHFPFTQKDFCMQIIEDTYGSLSYMQPKFIFLNIG